MGQPETADVNSSLFCFKDKTRVCGPDCMAYLHPPPKDPEYQLVQWGRCGELVSLHRSSKHLTIIAQQLAVLGKHVLGTTAAPAAAANIPPPMTR